jgi:PD-(D/E)XK endonuclease
MSCLPCSTCYSKRVGFFRRGLQTPRLFVFRSRPKIPQNFNRRKDWHSPAADAFLDLPMKKQCQARSRFADAPPGNRRPPRARNRKRQGELAELAFMCKAAGLGFTVAKPYGDSDRFDFIVSWGRHVCRVQVKSTRTAHRRVYEVSAHGCWGGRDIYTKDEIDFIVAYVVPEDAWYVIPIEATRGRKRLCLHPSVPRRQCYKYENYREAWGLMKPSWR